MVSGDATRTENLLVDTNVPIGSELSRTRGAIDCRKLNAGGVGESGD